MRQRPRALPVHPETIPADLAERPRFLLWRYRYDAGTDSWKKPPCSITGGSISVSDPGQLATLAEAIAALPRVSGAQGVGFLLTDADPFVAVDLDHCRNPQTGEIEQWAFEIVRDLGSYTEVSPSGSGLRVIVQVNEKRSLTGGGKRKRGDLECHLLGGYVTLTGHALPGRGEIRENSAAIASLWARLGPGPQRSADRRGFEQGGSSPSPTPAAGFSFTDAEIEEIIRQVSPRVAAIFDGDASGFPSLSEATWHFCGLCVFAWATDEQIDRMVRSSMLMRSKWCSTVRTRDGGRSTWGREEIAKARVRVTDRYTPRSPSWKPTPATAPTHAEIDGNDLRAVIEQLRDRLRDAEAVIEQLRDENGQLRRSLETDAAIRRNENMSGTDRNIASAVSTFLRAAIADGATDTEGFVRMPDATIASSSGGSEPSVRRFFKAAKSAELLRQKIVPVRVPVIEPATGLPVIDHKGRIVTKPQTHRYVALPEGIDHATFAATLASWRPARPERRPAAKAIDAGSSRCADHPEAGTVCAACAQGALDRAAITLIGAQIDPERARATVAIPGLPPVSDVLGDHRDRSRAVPATLAERVRDLDRLRQRSGTVWAGS